jgi:hypothetical protein
MKAEQAVVAEAVGQVQELLQALQTLAVAVAGDITELVLALLAGPE